MTSSKLTVLYDRVYAHYDSMDTRTRNCALAGHWWDHVGRVTNNALLLLRDYVQSNKSELVVAAALCHDLNDPGLKDAAAVQQAYTRCLGLMKDIGYSRADAEFAAELILSSDRDVRSPVTLEERVLYVADKLDLMGLDGVTRLIIEHALKGTTVREEVAETVAKRLKDWHEFMLSLDVGTEVVESRFDDAIRVLDSLKRPTLNLG